MDTNSHFHLIEKYLFDQMNEDEKKEFEILTKSDSSLEEEFEIQKSVFESANDEDLKKIYPALKLAEEKYLSGQTKKPPFRLIPIYRLAIVACIAFILIFSWNFFSDSNNKSLELFTSYYEPYPMILSFRGKSDLIPQAVNSYNSQNYESVIKSMNQLILIDSLGVIPNMYLGIAHLELGNFDEAIENFEAVSNSNNPTLRQQANWYMALTFLKANEPEKAKSILTKLSMKEGADLYQESAKEILKQI